MATINEVRTPLPGVGVKLFWETLTESDSAASAELNGTEGTIASVQVTGTFGSATVVLQVSNDGTNFATLEDMSGDAISGTAAYMAEFSTGSRYIRPSASGGTGQDVDVTVILRG